MALRLVEIEGYPHGTIALDRRSIDLLRERGHVVLYEAPPMHIRLPIIGNELNEMVSTVTLSKVTRSDGTFHVRVSAGDATKLSRWEK